MLFDYHIHTPLCRHAVGTPAEYVRQAREAGLGEMGFSDHNPMPTAFDDWRMGPEDLPRYLALVEEAKSSAGEFPIRLGLECDYLPGYEDHVRFLAKQADWDYLIGAVHYVEPHWDIDNPAKLAKWEERPIEEVWRLYFAAYARMAASGLFDFLAHPDLVKKFGKKPPGDLADYYRDAVDAIADAGLAIEVSTAGLRKEAREIYPAKRFLEMAHRRHIPVLLSSDAHRPEEVAYRFDLAFDLVREVGYRRLLGFERRKPIPVAIG
ncbi:histidinol-phosphatase HisJ family protein [Verrucomicrobium sp. 3C]|uniref:histidinol-phosphatase HisJ family protein n=1 Tax=Verrucomicrobium sp. 3C TaxID=1134055 RepID=UPI00036F6D3E|nr:histidinol-phosphatase HisJ family protein [Verrucomicrobium sp. 3C]